MKRLTAFLLTICLCCFYCAGAYAVDVSDTDPLTNNATGEIVVRVQIRLRELGYFHYKATGRFQSMSADATKRFQQFQSGASLLNDGIMGEESKAVLFSQNAVRAPIAQDVKIPIGPSLQGEPAVVGQLVDWGQLKDSLAVGTGYTVTDFNTGKQFVMVYLGGENHAEMECASASDTAVFKEIFNTDSSFYKRPVVLTVEGRLIAASLQGHPHGEDQVAGNEMSGHACMHFNGSLSHVGMLPDAEHRNHVFTAAGQ